MRRLTRYVGPVLAATSVAAALVLLALSGPAGAAGGSGAQASAAKCRSSVLVPWLPTSNGNGTVGSVYYKVAVTNFGSGKCTVSGYPTVRPVGVDGAPIGPAAAREDGKATSFPLFPGDATRFQLRVVAAGNFSRGECKPELAAGFSVALPGAGGSKVIPFPFETCTRKTRDPALTVGPLA